MAEAPKPIKRSPQLAPLSREHHEGLLFVWKLRQGLSKNIGPNRMAAFVQWFWHHYLAPHFQKEEQILPLVLPNSHSLLKQMFSEHKEIEIQIERITQYADLKKFELLAQHVNDHIQFEERRLFAEVEKTATPEQLQTIAEQLGNDAHAAVWEDQFWITLK